MFIITINHYNNISTTQARAATDTVTHRGTDYPQQFNNTVNTQSDNNNPHLPLSLSFPLPPHNTSSETITKE